jgi:hypothetical protein
MRASHDPAAIDLRPSQLNRDIAPIISNRRMSNWPAFETRPSRSLPPEECCRGTSPTQAAKSRILFLVDRRALGKQTSDALETTEIEGLLNFAQIYKVAGSETKVPEDEDQVQVATVQSLIARILNEPDPAKRPTPGTFDCIIVDEAHRGYTLDAELRETDIGFRNLDDYQSAYRQILDYFDAVKVALTATPALHTREIFGRPVFHYGYRQAVRRGLPQRSPATKAHHHGDGTGFKLVRKFGKSCSSDASAQDDPLLRIQDRNTVEVLAQINSKGHNGHWFAPSSQTHRHHTSKPAGGAGHPIKVSRRNFKLRHYRKPIFPSGSQRQLLNRYVSRERTDRSRPRSGQSLPGRHSRPHIGRRSLHRRFVKADIAIDHA